MESDVRGFFPHFITVLVTTVCAESVTYGAGCPMGEAQKREREEGGVGRCGAAPIHPSIPSIPCGRRRGAARCMESTPKLWIGQFRIQVYSPRVWGCCLNQFTFHNGAQPKCTRLAFQCVRQCQTDSGGAAQEWHEVVNVIGAADGRVQLVTLVGYGVHTRSSVGGFAGRNVIPDLPPGPVPRAVPQALRGLQCRDGACSVVKRVRQKGLRDSKRHI